MQRPNQYYLERSDKIQVETDGGMSAERNFVTLVSRQTMGDVHMAESRRADITQQALSLVPVNSENARRADYVAAGFIVPTPGGWLGGEAMGIRIAAALIYVSLIALSAVLAGVALGALMGFGFITVNAGEGLLFAIAVVAVLLLGASLGLLMLWSNEPNSRTTDEITPSQQVLVPVREVNPPAVIRVEDAYPRVLVPVEDATTKVQVPVQVATSRVLVPIDKVIPPVLVPLKVANSRAVVQVEDATSKELVPVEAHYA